MKALTVKQLREDIAIHDWIWVENISLSSYSGYYKIVARAGDMFILSQIYKNETFYFSEYGKKWIAYKFKEQICPHDVCCFPECEIQQFCVDALVKAKIDNMKSKGEIAFIKGVTSDESNNPS